METLSIIEEKIPYHKKVDIATRIISSNWEELQTWEDLYKLIHSHIQYIYCVRENELQKTLPN